MSKRYILWFANDYLNFRWPEIDSICSFYNLSIKWLEKKSLEPFIAIECPEPDLKRLLSRSILIRSAYELLVKAKSRSDLIQQLKTSSRIIEPQFVTSSFKFQVETFNRKITSAEKVQRIEQLAFLPFKGPIKMTDPDNVFGYFEFYGLQNDASTEEPEKIYFGLYVGDAQRHLITKLSLKKRIFISNTSMDPAYSILMANIAQVDDGDLVIDPFVGSGSILVAVTHFGAHVMGTDIDYKLLFGLSRPSRKGVSKRSPDESVYSNLEQYGHGSKYVDVLLSDASLPIYRQNFQFDAIICDPPYGIRESSEKVGTKKTDVQIPESLIPEHYPAKVHYNLQDCIQDLLKFSATHLAKGRRLVYWIPVFRGEDGQLIDQDEPSHPCFEVISTTEQVLAGNYSRILVCMEKVKEPHETEYKSSNGDNPDMPAARTFRQNFFKDIKTKIERKKVMKQLPKFP